MRAVIYEGPKNMHQEKVVHPSILVEHKHAVRLEKPE